MVDLVTLRASCLRRVTLLIAALPCSLIWGSFVIFSCNVLPSWQYDYCTQPFTIQVDAFIVFFFNFFENTMNFVLVGLKLMSHCLAHAESFVKSLICFVMLVFRFSTGSSRQVSLANNKISLSMPMIISLT